MPHIPNYMTDNGRQGVSLSEQLLESNLAVERLSEGYSAMTRAILDFDNVGWKVVSNITGSGVTLEEVKEVASEARKTTTTSPMLKRGASLRGAYVFGRGFSLGDLKGPQQKIVDDPVNQAVLFGPGATKKNERTLFTDGNFFTLFNRKTKRFSRVPLGQITGVVTDIDDNETIHYYQRTYKSTNNIKGENNPDVIVVWIPVDTFDGRLATRIQDKPVDPNLVIVDIKVNNDSGDLWGIPDCLPAIPWVWAYSEYMKDGSKLLKALSSIAWQVKQKTSKGVQQGVAKIAGNRTAGSTAVTGDVEINSLPRSNSVDLGTGRPLASMAATAMEVSVIALLSDPGAAQGSNAAATTLDQPTINSALARQQDWKAFYDRCLKLIGVTKPNVKFKQIIVDPGYRSVQSLSQLWSTGLADPKVILNEYAELLDIEQLMGGTPVDGVMIPNNEKFVNTLSNDGLPEDKNGKTSTPATGQGKSGAGVGKIADGDNSARDADKAAKS